MWLKLTKVHRTESRTRRFEYDVSFKTVAINFDKVLYISPDLANEETDLVFDNDEGMCVKESLDEIYIMLRGDNHD